MQVQASLDQRVTFTQTISIDIVKCSGQENNCKTDAEIEEYFADRSFSSSRTRSGLTHKNMVERQSFLKARSIIYQSAPGHITSIHENIKIHSIERTELSLQDLRIDLD